MEAESLLRDFNVRPQEVRTKGYTVVDDLAAGPLDVMPDDEVGIERSDLFEVRIAAGRQLRLKAPSASCALA